MSKETEFARIKRAVEEQKGKKVQAETRLESIEEERNRIFKEAKEITGKDFSSAEEVEAYTNELREDIEGKVREMGEILKQEGVSY